MTIFDNFAEVTKNLNIGTGTQTFTVAMAFVNDNQPFPSCDVAATDTAFSLTPVDAAVTISTYDPGTNLLTFSIDTSSAFSKSYQIVWDGPGGSPSFTSDANVNVIVADPCALVTISTNGYKPTSRIITGNGYSVVS